MAKQDRVDRLVAELKRLTGNDYAPKPKKAKAKGVSEPVEQPKTRGDSKKKD